MRSLSLLWFGVLALLPSAVGAQAPQPDPVLGMYFGPPIAARQAAPEEVGRMAVPSPMLLDISLGAYGASKSFRDTVTQQSWSVGVTAAFECERARVDWVQIDRVTVDARGRVQLHVVPTLALERPGRTVELTVAFLADGREIQRRSVRVFTGEPPPPEWSFEFTNQEFAAMFDPARSPVLRIILEV
jgi:hypothetical protein